MKVTVEVTVEVANPAVPDDLLLEDAMVAIREGTRAIAYCLNHPSRFAHPLVQVTTNKERV